MFRLATLLLLALTILIIGVNAAGWVLIRRMYLRLRRTPYGAGHRAESSDPAELIRARPEGFWNLTSIIRIEAAYFLLLLLYWMAFPGVLSTLPAMFVVIYHFLGFVGNEWTGLARRAERGTTSRHGMMNKVVRAVAVLDGLEMIVLAYVSWKLGTLLLAS